MGRATRAESALAENRLQTLDLLRRARHHESGGLELGWGDGPAREQSGGARQITPGLR